MRDIFLAVIIFSCSPALAQQYIAVDGDTLGFGKERLRVLGLDSPETFQPQCASEARLGYAAAGRLQKLLNTRTVRIERTSRLDKYRRTLARVFVGQDDVAAILIREGLARPYAGGRRQSWCPAGSPRAGAY